ACRLAGVRVAREGCEGAVVIRVSGLCGAARSGGKGRTNFVETMLGLVRAGRALRVVSDQVLGPSYTLDLARVIWRVIGSGHTGLYHVTSGGQTAWHDVAPEILRLEGRPPPLTPGTAAEYGARARRPLYSVLAHDALHALGIAEPRPWQPALAAYLAERRAVSVSARPGSRRRIFGAPPSSARGRGDG